MEPTWTESAREDLRAISQFLGQDSLTYAQRTVERIIARVEQLGQFPESGRVVPEVGVPAVRELIERPYRIVYAILPDRIDILAVVHGARGRLDRPR